jgi:hypothetical protein
MAQVDIRPNETGWVEHLHPDRLVALFGAPLTRATALRMRAHPRLRLRLAEALQAPLQGEGLWPPPTSSRLAAMPLSGEPDGAVRLVRAVGAAWHGQSLRAILSGPVLARLATLIGEEAMSAGIKLAENGVAPASVQSADEIAAAVDRDGPACLAAWLDRDALGAADALRLALPPALARAAQERGEAHRDAAARLVPAVLSQLADSKEHRA